MKYLSILIIALLFSGCANRNFKLFQTNSKSNNTQTSKAISYFQAQGEYRILKHDRVAINIYKHKDLISPELNSRGILVDSSGSVSLPLVGRVRIAGLTQPQAQTLLEKKFARYLKNPELNLEVINKRVYVLGEVKKPGVVALDKERTTVIEALAFAGDLTDDAKRDDIIVLSSNSYGRMELRHINLTNFNKLELSNLALKANDIVYVQPRSGKIIDLSANNSLAPLNIITKIAAPFVSIKTLSE